jgi:hypothetical protein
MARRFQASGFAEKENGRPQGPAHCAIFSQIEANPSMPDGKVYVFGGLSCMAAACFTNPADVIKVREWHM